MSILDSVRQVCEAIRHVHDAKLQAELQDAILALQGECFSLQKKNVEILAQNRELTARLELIESRERLLADYRLDRNAYWKGGTCFCVACLAGRDRAIPLICDTHHGACPVCKLVYRNVIADDRSPIATSGGSHRGRAF